MIPRVLSAPESWADWPDDRNTCGACGNRSGFRCIPRKISTHPLELKHRCDSFAKRVEFKRAA